MTFRHVNIAYVANVSVRAKCYVSRTNEVSGRAKIGARAKREKEGVESSLARDVAT